MHQGRKPREEAQGQKKDYTCGCGKTYFSYPALYLHLKIKHNGQRPEGTIIYKTVIKIIQQIRNSENNQAPSFNQSFSKDYDQQNSQNTDQKLDKKPKSDDTSIFQMISLLKPNQYQILNFDEAKDILISCQKYYPMCQTFSKIIQLFSEQKILEGKLKFNEIQDLKIYEIFSKLLIKTYSKLCSSSYKLLIIYLFTYVQCLNLEAWNILQRLNIVHENQEDGQEFCINQTGENVLEVINDFIEVYVLKALKKFQLDYDIGKAINFCQQFSDWLYSNNFTHSKLLLNEEQLNNFKEELSQSDNQINPQQLINCTKLTDVKEELKTLDNYNNSQFLNNDKNVINQRQEQKILDSFENSQYSSIEKKFISVKDEFNRLDSYLSL